MTEQKITFSIAGFPFFNVFNAESLGGLMQILHPIQSQAFEIFTQG